MAKWTAGLLACLACAVVASPAAAAPTLNGTFAVPDTPAKLTAGPDGNVWVVIGGGSPGLARFTPNGTRTDFPLAGLNGLKGITAGPDGNLWVTASNTLVKVPPANPAGFQTFTINDIITAQAIVTGPDGNLWTASADKVLRIPPSNPAGFTLFTLTSTGSPSARGIASAGGALWVADFGGAIARVAPDGTQSTPFAVGGGPQEVGGAPDGTVLFANPGAVPQTVGRIAPGGQPITTNVPGTDPFGITYGPDGAFWFAQFAAGKVARIAADGTITSVTVSGANDPREIAAGPNNTLWVALEQSKQVARITGVDPPPAPVTPTTPGGGAAPADTTAPVLSGLRVVPSAFRTGRRPGAVRPAAAGAPAQLRLTLSEPATVRLSAERLLPGRRAANGRCAAPSRANRARPRCVRAVAQGGTVSVALGAGAGRLRFSGRLATVLAAGSYRLVAVPQDGAGNRGAPRRAAFRVLAPTRR